MTKPANLADILHWRAPIKPILRPDVPVTPRQVRAGQEHGMGWVASPKPKNPYGYLERKPKPQVSTNRKVPVRVDSSFMPRKPATPATSGRPPQSRDDHASGAPEPRPAA